MPLRQRLAWSGLIAVLAVVARVMPTPRTIDDAFITFRYARNLLSGAGFVFNAGQRVLGTTTPLYTLLMAGLAALLRTGNYPWLSLLVNALADAATCLLLVALGTRLTGRRAIGLGAAVLWAVWAVAPMSATFAVGRMHTPVPILLLVDMGYASLAGCTGLAALCAGLAACSSWVRYIIHGSAAQRARLIFDNVPNVADIQIPDRPSLASRHIAPGACASFACRVATD